MSSVTDCCTLNGDVILEVNFFWLGFIIWVLLSTDEWLFRNHLWNSFKLKLACKIRTLQSLKVFAIYELMKFAKRILSYNTARIIISRIGIFLLLINTVIINTFIYNQQLLNLFIFICNFCLPILRKS